MKPYRRTKISAEAVVDKVALQTPRFRTQARQHCSSLEISNNSRNTNDNKNSISQII